MEEQSQVKQIEKIQIAANINGATFMPNLMQLIGYRQRIAHDLLRADGLFGDVLQKEFDYYNEQIKQLLGI